MSSMTAIDQTLLQNLAQELVRTPSLSTQEGELAQLIYEEMLSAGLHDVRIDAMGNVLGWLGSGDGPTLLMDAHMDTVAVGDLAHWQHAPFAGEIENGLLYGRGACDMKGGLAAMLHAARVLQARETDLKGRLCLACVVQEEPCEGMAMRHVVEQEGVRPDWVVLAEPTNLQVARGQRGRIELNLQVHGKGSHAAAPQLGINAIYEAARLIVGIELLAPQLGYDPFLGQGSIAVTEISSTASSRNAVPEGCNLCIDRRLTAGDTETKVLAEMRRILTREGVQAEVTIPTYEAASYTGMACAARQFFPYWTTPENHPLIRAASLAVDATLGYLPRLTKWEFSTDGVYTAGEAGIPTIGFGPGDERLAHAADEHVALADLASAARVYVALANICWHNALRRATSMPRPGFLANHHWRKDHAMQWELMTSPQLGRAAADPGICVLTLGVLERHSEHLPLGTDYLNAHRVACKAAEVQPAVVFPPFYFGQIFEARAFPGAVTLKPALLLELLQGVLDEIGRNGFDKIVLYNGHGGNNHLAAFLVQCQLWEEKPYSVYLAPWGLDGDRADLAQRLLPPDRGGHAGAYETSTTLANAPEGVHLDDMPDHGAPPLGRLDHLGRGFTALSWYANYPEHYAGDARLGSEALGKRLVALEVEALAEFIAAVAERYRHACAAARVLCSRRSAQPSQG